MPALQTMPTRIDADLFEAAKATASSMSRSAAQQINHWARLGRIFESAAGISHRDIVRVLEGQSSYDALSDEEQMIVRATWEERLAADGPLDLSVAFEAAGVTDWVEADDDGNTVIARPSASSARRERPSRGGKASGVPAVGKRSSTSSKSR